MKHLFDPFFTTRRDKGGMGLGLFVSHGIIKGHNGQLEAESEGGKGTTFFVKLPALEKIRRSGQRNQIVEGGL